MDVKDMKALDWFAGMALEGLLAQGPDPQKSLQLYASKAYQLAKAMLTERDRLLEDSAKGAGLKA